jgi:multiple sugar transport system substrate-binding protein
MGGSTLGISRDSRNPEAAWIFLQWASSPQVHARAVALSGATPIRRSAYPDGEAPPRLAHLPATLATIEGMLGSEPRLAAWPDLAVDGLANELGWLVQGAQDLPTTLRRMAVIAEQAAYDHVG